MNRTIGLVTTNYSLGDFGTLTAERPEASLPFGGRYRLLDFALSNLVNARIQTVGLITPYFYRSILDHVGAGKAWGLDRKDGGLYILPGTVYGFRAPDGPFSGTSSTTSASSARAMRITFSSPAAPWPPTSTSSP